MHGGSHSKENCPAEDRQGNIARRKPQQRNNIARREPNEETCTSEAQQRENCTAETQQGNIGWRKSPDTKKHCTAEATTKTLLTSEAQQKTSHGGSPAKSLHGGNPAKSLYGGNTKTKTKMIHLLGNLCRTDVQSTVIRASRRCLHLEILWLHQSPSQTCHS